MDCQMVKLPPQWPGSITQWPTSGTICLLVIDTEEDVTHASHIHYPLFPNVSHNGLRSFSLKVLEYL